MSQNQSPLEGYRGEIENLFASGLSAGAIAKALKKKSVATSEKSIRRALKRWGLMVETSLTSFQLDGDDLNISGPPTAQWTTPEDLLQDRGLDPEDWENHGFSLNAWDSPTGETLHQVKAHFRRKKPVDWLWPAEMPGPDYIRPKVAKKDSAEKLVVFVSDMHCPYHDPIMHDLFCNWLEDHKPDIGIDLGDICDFPDVSRHMENPEWNARAQESINSAYLVLRDRAQASENTDWTLIPGNHDVRIRDHLIRQGTKITNLAPAQIPGSEDGTPFHSLRRLLHLDSLGIEYLEPVGKYSGLQVKVSKYLAGRHGWLATQGSGATALKTLKHLQHSIVVGHTHRLAQVHHTVYDIDGEPTTLVAAENGCGCVLGKGTGLGHSVSPDWANGFSTAVVYPDGRFKLDQAVYVNKTLFYKDRRYS